MMLWSYLFLCHTICFVWFDSVTPVSSESTTIDASKTFEEPPAIFRNIPGDGIPFESDTSGSHRSKRSYQRLLDLLRGPLGSRMIQAYNNRRTRGYMYPGLSRRFMGSRGKREVKDNTNLQEHRNDTDTSRILDNSPFPGTQSERVTRSTDERGEAMAYDNPAFAFFGTRGKKSNTESELPDINGDIFFDYSGETTSPDLMEKREVPGFYYRSGGQKHLGQTFWGSRGKKDMESVFFGTRGKKSIEPPITDDEFMFRHPSEDVIPEINEKRANLLKAQGEAIDPSQAFWGVRRRRNGLSGQFWGVRGKKDEPSQRFWGVRGKKDDPSQRFWGVRGKKDDPSQRFWGVRGKKDDPSQQFWGVRGKKGDPSQEFWGVRGKKDDPSQQFWGVRGKKYDPSNQFWGVRGKKDVPSQRFWGVRGKRETASPGMSLAYNPSQAFFGVRGRRADVGQNFWGTRGKKSSTNAFSPLNNDGGLRFWGSRGKKELGNSFWGSRGKKADGYDVGLDQAFWGVRGKRGEDLSKTFWGVRGKKEGYAPNYMFWGTRGKRGEPSKALGHSSVPVSLSGEDRGKRYYKKLFPWYNQFWEIKGKKIDPSKIFYGVRGKKNGNEKVDNLKN